MIRTFSNTPVEQSVIKEILENARRAPSAGNTQATEFLVLNTPDAVKNYWATSMSENSQTTFRWQSLLTAPVLVLVLTRPQAYLDRYTESDKAPTGRGVSEQQWPVPYWWVDAGAVLQNLLLLVTERGLGCCLFGPFDHEPALRSMFSIPEDRRIVATLAIGHPTDLDASGLDSDARGRSSGRPRPRLDSITHWGRWSPDGTEPD